MGWLVAVVILFSLNFFVALVYMQFFEPNYSFSISMIVITAFIVNCYYDILSLLKNQANKKENIR